MDRIRRDRHVVALDDFFPNLRTGFRVAEFNAHLRAGVIDSVQSTAAPFGALVHEFEVHFPDLAGRVRPYSPESLATVDVAYVVFLNNAAYYLPPLESARVPFVVTLYPGGGLNLGDPAAERKLRTVLASPMLRHVITTQPVVTEHVREILGDTSRVPVTEILGVVTSPEFHTPGAGMRTEYYGSGKTRLDLAFVAFKYTERGADKGFPEFAEFVGLASRSGIDVHAHVVGGFTPEDLCSDQPADLFTFHPPKSTRELRQFFADKDLIVSPNRADVLGPGAFDGFPLGSSIEAALSGVAVMASDELNQNRAFRDGRDIVITSPNPRIMLERLRRVLAEPGGLRRLAQAGLQTARRHYSPAVQIDRRSAIIGAVLEELGGDQRHGEEESA